MDSDNDFNFIHNPLMMSSMRTDAATIGTKERHTTTNHGQGGHGRHSGSAAGGPGNNHKT